MALAEHKKGPDKMREIVFHLSRLRSRCCLQHEGTIRFSFIICIWVGHGSLGQYQNSTSRHSCALGEEEFMIKQLWQMMRGEQSHRGGTLCSHHTWNIIPVHGLCPAASLDPDWMCILVGRVWYMSHYKVHVYVPVLLWLCCDRNLKINIYFFHLPNLTWQEHPF